MPRRPGAAEWPEFDITGLCRIGTTIRAGGVPSARKCPLTQHRGIHERPVDASDLSLDDETILEYYLHRWKIEVITPTAAAGQ